MERRTKISQYVAGLVFLVISFLFIHSETGLLGDHTNVCDSTDLCLILKKAGVDSPSNMLNFHQILENHSAVIPFEQPVYDPTPKVSLNELSFNSNNTPFPTTPLTISLRI